jgi:hypothetical protein
MKNSECRIQNENPNSWSVFGESVLPACSCDVEHRAHRGLFLCCSLWLGTDRCFLDSPRHPDASGRTGQCRTGQDGADGRQFRRPHQLKGRTERDERSGSGHIGQPPRTEPESRRAEGGRRRREPEPAPLVEPSTEGRSGEAAEHHEGMD